MLSITTTESVVRTCDQDHAVLTSCPGLHFLNTINVDDSASMNPNKHTRINLRFDVVQSVAKQMGRVSETKTHVVALSFNCIYIRSANKEDLLAILDSESLQIRCAGSDLLQHAQDPCGVRFSCTLQKDLRLIDSLGKPFSIERFCQIVDGVRIEGT